MEQLGKLNFLEGLPGWERAKHVTGGQSHWQLLCSQLFKGMTVIDCGAGDGSGSALLRGQGDCHVISIDPSPAGPGVRAIPLRLVNEPADATILIDVLEHVFDPGLLLAQAIHKTPLVFFSTPNWNHSHCENVFHVFEFTPPELDRFIAPFILGGAHASCFGGTSQKCIVQMGHFDNSHFPPQFGVLLSRDSAQPKQVDIRPQMREILSLAASRAVCPTCAGRLEVCILGTGLICQRCSTDYIPSTNDISTEEAQLSWMPEEEAGPKEPPWLELMRKANILRRIAGCR